MISHCGRAIHLGTFLPYRPRQPMSEVGGRTGTKHGHATTVSLTPGADSRGSETSRLIPANSIPCKAPRVHHAARWGGPHGPGRELGRPSSDTNRGGLWHGLISRVRRVSDGACNVLHDHHDPAPDHRARQQYFVHCIRRMAHIYPVMILHLILLPVNAVRLVQIQRLVRGLTHLQSTASRLNTLCLSWRIENSCW